MSLTLERRPPAADPLRELRDYLRRAPPEIPARYFYDDRGAELFGRITTLPEYYLTRAEREILERHAAEIATAARAEELLEFGSGSSEKTVLLLGALAKSGTLRRYLPWDCNEDEVRGAAGRLRELFPGLAVHGVIADFAAPDPMPPAEGPRLVAFLGSTIGNFRPDEARRFLGRIGSAMRPGDSFLLGVDLVKDPAILEAAYNDAEGVTAEFNRNILRAVNAVAGGDIDPARFDHRAFFDPREEWIEMRLVAREAQEVRLRALDLTMPFRCGDEIRTEISTKYRRAGVEGLLREAGLHPERWLPDSGNRFALSLSRRIA